LFIPIVIVLVLNAIETVIVKASEKSFITLITFRFGKLTERIAMIIRNIKTLMRKR
jgi:hypothetical protein